MPGPKNPSAVDRAASFSGCQWARRPGNVWLDAAFQGPLPARAVEALHAAGDLKAFPELLLEEDWFDGAPARLRVALGRFLGVPSEEVIIGNSTSWGLHLLAWSYPWSSGDEVLVVAGDFPANALPWSILQDRGVRVRYVTGRGGTLPTPSEVEEALTPATRLFCASWVHSFTGEILDAHGIAEACRRRDVRSVLNASQGLGALPDLPGGLGVDAVVGCGWKWLCGPYGTGYAWFTPSLLDRLEPPLRYWRTEVGMTGVMHGPGDGAGDGNRGVLPGPGIRRFDKFAAASFFNVLPWTAALEVLLELGVARVAGKAAKLADRLSSGLPREVFASNRLSEGPMRSPIVIVQRRTGHLCDADAAVLHRRLAAAGIHGSLRAGRLRFAPHVYNTRGDVDRALEVLAERA